MRSQHEISGRTHMVSLLGNPTSHSLSPAIHDLSFKLLGIDSVYLCFDLTNDDLAGIVSAFKAMESWDGFNVTMPYKQAIVEHLYGLDETAELIGAVNVVSKSIEGYVIGHNTDGVGFMASLADCGVCAKGARMVLLGPGGAGRAILVQAALDGVAHIDVFARAAGNSYRETQDVIEGVVERTGCEIALYDFASKSDLEKCVQAADILVNTTPIGMGENCTDTPVPAQFIKPGMVVADAIYYPRETQLIRDAKACGCTVVPGLGMLLQQAAASEEIWYGVDMPTQEIASQLFA